MMAFVLATDLDFIAYMSKIAFFLEAFFTSMAFLEYDITIELSETDPQSAKSPRIRELSSCTGCDWPRWPEKTSIWK